MEIYHAKEGADGNFVKEADGHLLKDRLAKVYVRECSKKPILPLGPSSPEQSRRKDRSRFDVRSVRCVRERERR